MRFKRGFQPSPGSNGCASPADYLLGLNVVFSDDIVSNPFHNADHSLWVRIAFWVIQPLQEFGKTSCNDRVESRHYLRLDEWPLGLLVPDVTDTLVPEIRNAALADNLVQFATDGRSFQRKDRVVLLMDL